MMGKISVIDGKYESRNVLGDHGVTWPFRGTSIPILTYYFTTLRKLKCSESVDDNTTTSFC